MKIGITADLSEFRRALKAVEQATRKDGVEIVNKALKDVAFRAASFTPKANAAAITSELRQPLLAKLASASLKAKQGRFTRAEHSAEMKRIVAARKRGIGALRAGWIPAILALGGKFRGAKLRTGGSASDGTAKPATLARLKGEITNAVMTTSHNGKHSADQIAVAVSALDKAIAFVTRDRFAYARRKIEQTLRKHSDK